MISIEEAEKLISEQCMNYGEELVDFENSAGRVLAEDIFADRDMPPFNRATMDGIAVAFSSEILKQKSFEIAAVQAAGTEPLAIGSGNECIEIMTGCALHPSVDTVIRYEDIDISDGIATINVLPKSRWQNVHRAGIDRKKNDVLIFKGKIIDPLCISILSSVGKQKILVKRVPAIAVISTGDELVDLKDVPVDFQIRRSNGYTIQAVLKKYKIDASLFHISDLESDIHDRLKKFIEKFDVIILSGGVSMGKFDHIPQQLSILNVTTIFHHVKQRPGKPFYFGKAANNCLLFALPGNPVSTFCCLYRYVLPWLEQTLGIKTEVPKHAILTKDVSFSPDLTYFVPVVLRFENASLTATPVEGNGSGDFANLLTGHAFMELPAEQNNFTKGSSFRIWNYSSY